MSGVSVGIKVNEQSRAEADRIMREVQKRGLNLSKPYRKFSVYFHRVTVQGMDKGGRGAKWPPLAPMTLILRKARGKRTSPRRMLQDRGILKGSLAPQITNRDMRFGTSVPYAPIHQFGGKDVMELAAVTIRPKRAKALRFVSRSGEVVFAKKVDLPRRRIPVKIPPRPYLVYRPEDEQMLIRYMDKHIQGGAR